jgi:nucleotide-binding universal stress UspA family protein
MYKRIVVATDGTSLSAKAVEHGCALAKSVGAEVVLVTATEPFHVFSVRPEQVEDTSMEFRQHMKERAERALASAAAIADVKGVRFTELHVEHEAPYRAIIQAAEERDSDLIVMASRGRGGVAALLLGSETMKVLTHSKIPVLVIH